jgi:hypothetical protein
MDSCQKDASDRDGLCHEKKSRVWPILAEACLFYPSSRYHQYFKPVGEKNIRFMKISLQKADVTLKSDPAAILSPAS